MAKFVNLSAIERQWRAGQEALAAGRYMAAIGYLSQAQRWAARRRNAAALARIVLPLLEARRQVRHAACEGLIVMAPPPGPAQRKVLEQFLASAGGTWIFAPGADWSVAARIAHSARRSGAALEALALRGRGTGLRLCSLADGARGAGIEVTLTAVAHAVEAAPPEAAHGRHGAALPLPVPGWHSGGRDAASKGLHAMAGESLLLAWEALALKWQSRHRPAPGAWQEIAWLQQTLTIDPACEPVLMRMMAVAEALARR